MKKYSVWVGGVEVTDYLVTKQDAEKIAREYRKEGYDDVQIKKLKNIWKLCKNLLTLQ